MIKALQPKLATSIISPTAGSVVGSKAQPRLLVVLSSRVQAETALLENPSDPSDPRKLQIYREVFEKFINEFKTYEPLLSEIKCVYDATIRAQKARIAELEPYQAKADIMKYEAAQEIAEYRAEAVKSMDELRVENYKLETENAAFQAEITRLEKHINVLADEVRTKDAMGTSEADLKKRVHHLQEQLEYAEVGFNEEIAKRDKEIEELRLVLAKKSDETAIAANEISRLKEIISTMVPLAEFEKEVGKQDELAKKNLKAEKEIQSLKETVDKLQISLNTKVSQMKKIEAQNASFPDWDMITFNCPGEIHEWVHTCKGSDSNECITILLRQLLAMKNANEQRNLSAKVTENEAYKLMKPKVVQSVSDGDYFFPLGLSADVPKFLRYKGKIVNRRISRRDCILLISDIWTAKAAFNTNPKNSKDTMAEWSYNIWYASKKHYMVSLDCRIFHDILEGIYQEDIFHYMQETVTIFKNLLHKYDLSIHEDNAHGVIPKANCMNLCRDFWPEKTSEQIDHLKKAIDSDQSGDKVAYSWLLSSESDSLFLETIKEQELELHDQYVTNLQQNFRSISKDMKLSAIECLQGMMIHDPEKPKSVLEDYLARGFNSKFPLVKPKAIIDGEIFLQNLRKGPIWYGKAKK
ncbi:Translin-associated factor X-interacting protein 1 [Entophlyctis sp. JEL0112]|nr:Translin-associated factor X-interacting protein 1 [Entophlyctis sp. JEL0112]